MQSTIHISFIWTLNIRVNFEFTGESITTIITATIFDQCYLWDYDNSSKADHHKLSIIDVIHLKYFMTELYNQSNGQNILVS